MIRTRVTPREELCPLGWQVGLVCNAVISVGYLLIVLPSSYL